MDGKSRSFAVLSSDDVYAIHHDLTLIDSSDDDAPFSVPAPIHARFSRRLVLVPESVDATPQSIQDRDWIAEYPTGPDPVPETTPDAFEEDSELQNRRLLLVSDGRDTESVGRVDMDVVGSNVEQEELPDESDSEELGSVISGAVEEVDEVEVEDVIPPRVAPAVVREAFRSLDDVNMVHEFSRRAVVM